ncbi:hypothetical protein QFZ50_001627 [Arthrobacter agilis]|nr:hypothetical protein [Arthrobacter agilis]
MRLWGGQACRLERGVCPIELANAMAPGDAHFGFRGSNCIAARSSQVTLTGSPRV